VLVQDAVKPKAVILLIVTTGAAGAGGSVVTLVVEDVGPVTFTAAITREYVVLANKPVKLADLLRTPASIKGVTNWPFIAYVYEVALKAPVQVAVNEVSLKLVIVTSGAVGAKGKVVILTELDDILSVAFIAVITKEYTVSGKSPVKFAVVPDTLGVAETVFSVYV
jgi:hypothetical protein